VGSGGACYGEEGSIACDGASVWSWMNCRREDDKELFFRVEEEDKEPGAVGWLCPFFEQFNTLLIK
jgi:hypothetical protein